MDDFLLGFSDELQKIASKGDGDQELKKILREAKKNPVAENDDESFLSKARGGGRQVRRDYLASTGIGAIGSPLAMMANLAVKRRLSNSSIRRAMSKASPLQRKRLKKQIDQRPFLGRKGKEGLVRPEDVAGSAVQGAVFGSVLQALRDRYSGAAGVKKDSPRPTPTS